MTYGGGVQVGCPAEHCPYIDDAWASTPEKAAAQWNGQVARENERRAPAGG